MSRGHHRTPVRTGSGPCVQEPPLASLPEDTWLEALPPPARGACQIASCPLDPGTTASGTARDFTRQILGSWGLLLLAEDAAVIVSELVTNALCHGVRDTDGPARDGSAHDRVELILLRRAGEMVCAVTDPGAGHPVMGTPDPAAEAGRGLHVVEALAASWGWTRLDAHNKAVWATLSVPGMDGGNGHLGQPALSRRDSMPPRGRCMAAFSGALGRVWRQPAVTCPLGAARSRPGSGPRGGAANGGGPGA
jgi:anti-sigma regulatory factor (Ser/Thr protein kinase)